ncbi:PEP-CTERM sorting domain-containing protein [Falsiroseomonas oryzae]|uniref:PEP-CTERM sorting domain-containing protein n=1 Tax=Falsiroseomonas oryzae TaxID=2766473 RepID=UPI0022EB4FE6|nr:PEP-CTERM sorting domain-containing protein [Roseomonas sp. MO-31]
MSLRLRMLSGLAAAALLAMPAAAATYGFTQGGWVDVGLNPQPGQLTFSFTGVDTNGDNTLTGGSLASVNEVTSFALSFTGNALIPAFSQGLPDLTLLTFPLGTASFADAAALLQTLSGDLSVLVGGAIGGGGCDGVEFCGLITDAASGQILFTAAVPVSEPATLGLFGLALAGLVAAGRRRAE